MSCVTCKKPAPAYFAGRCVHCYHRRNRRPPVPPPTPPATYTGPSFGGATYDPAEDAKRLASQLQRVRMLMIDRVWRTLAEIVAAIQRGTQLDSEGGVGARLRDLRKVKFQRMLGAVFLVERRRRGSIPGKRGLWEYRVTRLGAFVPTAGATVP